MLKVGVVGFSAQDFNTELASNILEHAFDYVEDKYQTDDIEIVSGLTNMGVPKLAYRIATLRGYWTTGVAPKCSSEFPYYKVKTRHIIGDSWGDESKSFVNMLDVFIRVGGGSQSITETQMAKNRKIEVLEFDLKADI